MAICLFLLKLTCYNSTDAVLGTGTRLYTAVPETQVVLFTGGQRQAKIGERK